MIEVSDTPIDASAALCAIQAEAVGAGAIVSFTGLVRQHSISGHVETLHLQAYGTMTVKGIEAAAARAKARWPLNALHVRHRVGDMSAGETIVFVAAASAHRRAAFEAADFMMDYLKTEAIFWKKEVTPNGEKWIEPRDEDYRDRARWTVEAE